MRRYTAWILLILATACRLEGEAVLRGKITLQNSGGAPIEGVQVKIPGINVNPTSTTDSGIFEFVINDKNPGQTVLLDVEKEGFEVLNTESLNVRLPDDPSVLVRIVLCGKGSRAKYALIYYRIAEKEINKIFEEKLTNEKLKISKEKDLEIQKLRAERDAALAQAKKIAEDFAGVDLDQASEAYKKAFAAFQQGKIDEALALLKDAELEQTIKGAAALEDKARQARKQAAQSYILKARLSIIKLRFDDAETYYDKALLADPQDAGNYLAYSAFLWRQNKFQKGQETCKKALALEMDEAGRAGFLNNIGVMYSDNNLLAQAEQAYTEALEIRRKLAADNPAAYLSDVAMTLNNLGILYKDTQRLAQAEQAYTEALEIRRKLAAENPAAYLSYAADSLNNLALLEITTEKYSGAVAHLKEALEIREKLAAPNPQAFDLDLCTTMLTIVFLSKSAPDIVKSAGVDITALLNRAIVILNKYPDIPLAQELLETIELLMKK